MSVKSTPCQRAVLNTLKLYETVLFIVSMSYTLLNTLRLY